MGEERVSNQRFVRGFPARLCLGYLLCGCAYIAASDRVLEMLVQDSERMTTIQSYKGWAFIFITAALLYLVVKSFTVQVARAEARSHAAAKEVERSLQVQRVLVGELDHRVRNNLASLVSLIEIGERDAKDVEHFAQTISGRVRAMATAYSMVADARWRPLAVGKVLGAMTEFAGERRTLQGPEVGIAPDQIVPLILVVHELVRNAREHGALRDGQGTLSVRWETQGEGNQQCVRVFWKERGGEKVVARGLGTGLEMAQGMARSDLRGDLVIRFAPEGLEADLTIGACEVRTDAAASTSAGVGTAG